MNKDISSTQRLPLVGIIANPASGKDIRRLVTYAVTVANPTKVRMLRCLLNGLAVTGPCRVWIMPDVYRLGEQALDGGYPEGIQAQMIPMPVQGTSADSQHAAEILCRSEACCIVVLGGDGTVRVVSKGAGEVPLLPLSTGTNNVLPTFIDGTVAGIAAGAVAQGWVGAQTMYRHKWLELHGPRAYEDRALVDVAVLRGRFVASRAVWRAADLRCIVVTRADPTAIGLSSIAALLRPVDVSDPLGLVVHMSDQASKYISAPLGPGMVVQVGVRKVEELAVGESLTFEAKEPLLLALDGEREMTLSAEQRVSITLRDDGPWIVDVFRVMREVARSGRLFDIENVRRMR